MHCVVIGVHSMLTRSSPDSGHVQFNLHSATGEFKMADLGIVRTHYESFNFLNKGTEESVCFFICQSSWCFDLWQSVVSKYFTSSFFHYQFGTLRYVVRTTFNDATKVKQRTVYTVSEHATSRVMIKFLSTALSLESETISHSMWKDWLLYTHDLPTCNFWQRSHWRYLQCVSAIILVFWHMQCISGTFWR